MTKLLVIAMLCLVGLKAALAMPVAENQEPLQVVPLTSPNKPEVPSAPEEVPTPTLGLAQHELPEAKSAEAEKPSVRSEPAAENPQIPGKTEEKKEEAPQANPEEKKEEASPEKKPEQQQQQQPQQQQPAESSQQPAQEPKLEAAPAAKKEEESLKLAASESHETVQPAPQEQKQDAAEVPAEQPVAVSLSKDRDISFETRLSFDNFIYSPLNPAVYLAEGSSGRGQELGTERLRGEEFGSLERGIEGRQEGGRSET